MTKSVLDKYKQLFGSLENLTEAIEAEPLPDFLMSSIADLSNRAFGYLDQIEWRIIRMGKQVKQAKIDSIEIQHREPFTINIIAYPMESTVDWMCKINGCHHTAFKVRMKDLWSDVGGHFRAAHTGPKDVVTPKALGKDQPSNSNADTP